MKKNRIILKTLMVMTIMVGIIFNSAEAVENNLISKDDIFKKDKVWNIQFNTAIKEESFSSIAVYSDKNKENLVEGVDISFKDEEKTLVQVKPPYDGYESGLYYLVVGEGVKAEDQSYEIFQDQYILKFQVDSDELASENIERNIFKHYLVEDKLRDVDTWIHNNNDSTVYDLVEEINKKNTDTSLGTVDVFELENSSKEFIKNKIDQYDMIYSTVYNKSGQVLNSVFREEVMENLNMEKIEEKDHSWYGIVTTRTDLKAFPTEVEFHRTKGDHFDRIQETSLEAGEAVKILHESLDEKWYFVQGKNYAGWVLKAHIGRGEKSQVEEFMKDENFIVITEDKVTFQDGDNLMEYYMGVRLPIEYMKEGSKEFMVKVPLADESGKLQYNLSFIGDVEYSIGYLELSRENIIKQIFKLQGTKYSWGDKGYGRDCSSTMMSVYRTMGVELPRNTDEQEYSYGERISLSGLGRSSRYEKAKELKTGDLLFLKGHEVMYLGNYEGKDYIIHNFTGATVKEDGTSKYEKVYRVGVTPMDMVSGGGTSYIDMYTSYLKILR